VSPGNESIDLDKVDSRCTESLEELPQVSACSPPFFGSALVFQNDAVNDAVNAAMTLATSKFLVIRPGLGEHGSSLNTKSVKDK
jgi:hypothetical protein